MAISSIGVGSGLPLDQLLSDLRSNERRSLTLIQNRTQVAQSRLSAYGTLKSGIDALKTAADKLGKTETYGATKTHLTTSAFTVESSASATPASYSVSVIALAQAQSLRAENGLDSSTDRLVSTGTVTISVELANGDVHDIELDAEQTSLEGIKAALNTSSDSPISASTVNNGQATQNHFLLLGARESGTEQSISRITVTGDGSNDVSAMQDLLDYDQSAPGLDGTGMTQVSAGINAQINVNGIDVFSQSNRFEGAISGLTLNAAQTTEQAQTLTVERDETVTRKAIEDFVTAYNTLQKTISTLTSYNPDTQNGSVLSGDSLARNAQTQLRGVLNRTVDGLSLSQIGISTVPQTGQLKIDQSVLTDALGSDSTRIQALFASGEGIAARIADVAQRYTGSGGIISNASDGLSRRIETLQSQYELASTRIDTKMEQYKKQFTQLDALMAQMTATGNYLTQQLSMLESLSKGSEK